MFKIRFLNKPKKEPFGMVGRIHIKVFEKTPIGTEYPVQDKVFTNTIVTVGKDTMLKYLGEVTGGAKIDKIGVGNSTQAVVVGDTALIGGSQLIKTISSTSRVFVRPTLFVSVEYGYSEANWTWNELGLYDANNVLIARQVDASPLGKTASKRAIVEWQLTIP